MDGHYFSTFGVGAMGGRVFIPQNDVAGAPPAELYGVSTWDPIALTTAAGAMIFCAAIAAVIPARRAASVSPTDALRTE